MAASETKLGRLHEKVAEVLLEVLDGEVLPGYGEGDEAVPDRRIPPSAAIIAAASKFLKDNDITCVPSESNALGELEQKMAERRKKRALSADDLAAARAQVSFMGLPN